MFLGALLGLLLALGVTALILVVGSVGEGGGEMWEVLGLTGGFFGVPVSLLLIQLPLFVSVGHSVPFVLVSLALNGALVGGIVGAVVRLVGCRTRWWLAVLPLVWAGLVALYAQYARTH